MVRDKIFLMKRNLTILFILLVGVIAGSYFFITYSGQDAGTQKPAATLTASELYEQYAADEDSGNQQFLGNILEVSGTVIDKLEDEEGAPVLVLGQQGEMSGVMCTLSGPALPDDIALGDDITVRGRCTGMLSDVVLNECRIIK